MTARLVGVAFPKTLTFRSEALRRVIVTLPCVCCGRVGRTQAAHLHELRKMKNSAAA